MTSTRRKTAAGAVVVGLIAGALGASPASAVPGLSDAGAIQVWGQTPASYPVTTANGPWRTAVSQAAGGNIFAIRGDGTLQRVAGSATDVNIPAAVAGQQVVSVDQYGNSAAGVVLASGSLYLWGARGFPTGETSVATLGAPAVQVATGSNLAFARLSDGRLGMRSAFGTGYELVGDPVTGAPLTGVVDVEAAATAGYALLADGRVVHINTSGVTTVAPADADPIIDIDMGVGVTRAGVVKRFTQVADSAVVDPNTPDELAGAPVEQIANVSLGTSITAVRTDTGQVVVWQGEGAVAEAWQVPAGIQGKVVDLTGGSNFQAIVGEPLPPVTVTTPASITGTPEVGQTLTGTPATFAGEPGTVVNQWLADGAEIAGATGNTLALTEAHLGKTITLRSTATRGPDTPVVSVSAPVGPVTTASTPVKVASTTTVAVAPPSAAYGKARTLTVSVTKAGGTPTGTVAVTVGGASSSLPLNAGSASLTVPATLAVGTHAVSASYAGDATTNPSAGSASVAVTKAASRSKVTAVKVKKKGKKVTVQMKVTAPAGVRPSGKIAVVIKRGAKKVAKKSVSVNAKGVASFTAKKLTKKGKYKVTASYGGSATLAASKATKAFKV
ncbi:Ig-like domain repeat protein [Nocardioides pantholopis]|uniref:Ig-like domain repeat protein n=1 Tax=Nocardioides pantholopis TaxID=2483798 RepID=UPI000FDAE52C|nr:Ig-like domain repeat protein [Nocardioides pantholopis]